MKKINTVIAIASVICLLSACNAKETSIETEAVTTSEVVSTTMAETTVTSETTAETTTETEETITAETTEAETTVGTEQETTTMEEPPKEVDYSSLNVIELTNEVIYDDIEANTLYRLGITSDGMEICGFSNYEKNFDTIILKDANGTYTEIMHKWGYFAGGGIINVSKCEVFDIDNDGTDEIVLNDVIDSGAFGCYQSELSVIEASGELYSLTCELFDSLIEGNITSVVDTDNAFIKMTAFGTDFECDLSDKVESGDITSPIMCANVSSFHNAYVIVDGSVYCESGVQTAVMGGVYPLNIKMQVNYNNGEFSLSDPAIEYIE